MKQKKVSKIVFNRFSMKKKTWENWMTRDLQTAKKSNMALAIARQIWQNRHGLLASFSLHLRIT